MKITILHNPKCSKSRQALIEAEACGYEVEIIEYLKATPTIKELKALLSKLSMKPEDIIRKKETLFIEHYAGKKFTPTQWLKILLEHPILIERPIIVKDKEAVIARSEASLAAIL